MGVAALVVSIIALVLGILSPILGVVLGITGLILGIISKKNKEKFALGGIIISLVAIIVSVIVFVLALVVTTKAVTKTIDKSRRQIFISTAQMFENSFKMSYAADEVLCTSNVNENAADYKTINALGNGDYYLFISTGDDTITSKISNFPTDIAIKAASQTSELVSVGGKSPWQNVDIYGWVHLNKNGNNHKYYSAITDVSGHGYSKEKETIKLTANDVKESDEKAEVDKIISLINNNSQSYYCHLKS